MKSDGKLSLALHALGHMAQAPGQPQTSERIAAQHGTHAVVVRRVLGVLRAAGIVQSEKGHAGGWRLARPADAITLADVYLALGTPLVAAPVLGNPRHPGCLVVATLQDAVAEAERQAEAALVAGLSRRSIADLAGGMDAAATASPAIAPFPPT